MKAWKAEFESKHFSFEAFGETKTGAIEAMKLGLKRHANQTNIDHDWFNPEDFNVQEIETGVVYRDGEKV